MKKFFAYIILAISLSITLLSLVSCDFENENGEVSGARYENAESYTAGNAELEYNLYSSIKINWVLGDITVQKTDTPVLRIYENTDATAPDDYKMHYLLSDGVLSVEFWASGYTAVADPEDKKLTVELPSAANTEIVISATSSDIYCKGGITVNKGEFDSISGKVEIENVSGANLLIATVSGNISAKDIAAVEFLCGTVSGNAELGIKSVKNMDIETVSGNILLNLNGNGASVKFSTVSGKYFSDTAGEVYGDGSATISAETVSGNLTVKYL